MAFERTVRKIAAIRKHAGKPSYSVLEKNNSQDQQQQQRQNNDDELLLLVGRTKTLD